MAKVILVCGKLCSGKSTYAKELSGRIKGVILSCDELMLALPVDMEGEKYDPIATAVKKYLLLKAAEISGSGVPVILDWGFWQKEERSAARSFFTEQKIESELHYLCVSDETWKERIDCRNKALLEGVKDVYFVDEGLLEKFKSLFEEPDPEEIDAYI